MDQKPSQVLVLGLTVQKKAEKQKDKTPSWGWTCGELGPDEGKGPGGLATLPGPGLGIGISTQGREAEGQHSQLGVDMWRDGTR